MAVARVTVRHRAAFLVRREHPAVRALALVGLVVLWELFTRLGWVPALFLPSPLGVLGELGDMARSGQLFVHVAASLERLLAGFAIGAAAGVAVGVLVVVPGPNYEEVVEITAKHTGARPEIIRVGFPYQDRNGRLLVPDVERQMKWWVDNGFMKRALPLDKIVDTTFLEDALKQVGP
jgi:hypothetical protein